VDNRSIDGISRSYEHGPDATQQSELSQGGTLPLGGWLWAKFALFVERILLAVLAILRQMDLSKLI